MSKTILIVGGTSGIGTELARAITANGDRVVITGRDEIRAKEAAAAIGDLAQGIAREPNRRVLLIDADLRNPKLHLPLGAAEVAGEDDPRALVDEVDDRWQRGPDAGVVGDGRKIDEEEEPQQQARHKGSKEEPGMSPQQAEHSGNIAFGR